MIQMKKGQIHSDINGAEHIMVCLSASPSNVKIIKTAAKIFVTPLKTPRDKTK